ncbi:MAG: TonB-dependent receptor [Bradyrhizobium sp.]|nr:TonB-dependent receptor [Bradyrhizobium sp.]
MTGTYRQNLKTIKLAACLSVAFTALSSTAAHAQSNQVQIDLPAQSLASAIRQVGRKTSTEIIFSASVVGNRRTPPLKGNFSAEEALRQLLSGSGLSARRTSQGAFVIERVQTSATSSPSVGDASREDASTNNNSSEDIVVTGTNIRGTTNNTVPLLKIDRAAIERAGYTSTQRLIQSLPQNFSGGQAGASETGLFGVGTGGNFNTSGATGVNLRGLGNSSTLTLLNGHRLAPTGFGQAVDISLIPLAAVDHVDVLTDGASAVYGSDAVAGVVNFVLRDDYKGAETGLSYGAASGGVHQEIVSQVVGTTWGSGGVLVAAQYDHRDNLPVGARSISATAPQPTDLLPDYSNLSFIAHVRQNISGAFRVFVDGSYSTKGTARQFTTGPITSASAFSNDQSSRAHQLNVVGGMDVDFGHGWSMEASGSFARQDDTFRQTYVYYGGAVVPPGGVIFGYVSGTPAYTDYFSIASGDVKIDGPAFRLPGGPVRIALGATYRSEAALFSEHQTSGLVDHFGRDVSAEFAEVYVPVVGADNTLPFVKALELSAALRHDHYSDFGDTTNPRFGLYWSPTRGLGLRGSYSTSFRAPSQYEMVALKGAMGIYSFPVAAPGGGVTPIFLLSGGSTNTLRPETSANYSFSGEWSPGFAKRLKLSLAYFHIDFRNRIITPTFTSSLLLQQNVYGSLIGRLADDAAAAAFLQAQIAGGANYVNVSGKGSTGVRYTYSLRETNAARVVEDGFDAAVQYAFDIGRNDILMNGDLTVINTIQTTIATGAARTDLANTYGNPLRYRGRGSLTWSRDGWSATGILNYTGRYRDTTVVPYGTLGAVATIDLNLTWSPKFMKGLSLYGNVANLLDRLPPLIAGTPSFPGIRYDVANGDPLGRMVTFGIRMRFGPK